MSFRTFGNVCESDFERSVRLMTDLPRTLSDVKDNVNKGRIYFIR